MRTNLIISDVKIFNIKPFGAGCRFGIKISGKRPDGSWSKGSFLNCKYISVLDANEIYTLEGFLVDNEYNNINSLEFVVMSAKSTKQKTQSVMPPAVKQNEKIEFIDFNNDDEIPF